MPLAACVRCKKLFTKEQSPICPECQPDEDADIEKVRGIIADSPDMNAEQVADKAEVEVGVVLHMIEGGIIEQVGALESAGIVCGRCGAPAISASICTVTKVAATVSGNSHTVTANAVKNGPTAPAEEHSSSTLIILR